MRQKFFLSIGIAFVTVSLSAQVVLQTATDTFPSSPSVGQTVLLTTVSTNQPRGIWTYVGGSKWSPGNGGVANVIDFGAYPNDATDDTSAINNAIAAVKGMATGGTVYFPAGTYDISSTISIDAGGVWLRGAGMTSTRLQGKTGITSNGAVIKFDGADDGPVSGIADLEIMSTVENNTWTGVWVYNSVSVFLDHVWTNGLNIGVKLEGSGDCVIESSALERSYTYGLYATTTSPLRVNDTEAFGNETGGFYLKDAKTQSNNEQTDPVILSNCQSLESAQSSGSEFGFKIEDYRNVTLIGPQVGDLNYEQDHGIRIIDSTRVNVVGAHITHSVLYGIKIENSTEVSVTGSVINATGYYSEVPGGAMAGIYADTPSKAISIVGGSINKAQGNGILFAARGGQISNVSIIDSGMAGQGGSGLSGIEVATTTSGTLPKVTIANNSFRIIDGGTTSRIAIKVTSGSGTDVIIDGNQVENVPTGLSANSAANIRVFKNLGIANDEDSGASLSSGSTLAVTNAVHAVTGTSTISSISVPSWCTAGCTVALVPKGAWQLTTGGNVAVAATAVVSRTMHVTYVPADSLWYPSYN